MPATHRIDEDHTGPRHSFKLASIEPAPAGVAPGALGRAARLAELITGQLERLAERRDKTAASERKLLCEIAEEGLAVETPIPHQGLARFAEHFNAPFVTPVGDDDLAVKVPRGTEPEQLDILFRLNTAMRLVRKLHTPRPHLGLRPWQWLAHLPDRLLHALALPPVSKMETASAAARAKAQADAEMARISGLRRARDQILRAGRIAFPDEGDDRKPDLPLAGRLLDEALAEASTDHGPQARRAYLADLGEAYVVTALCFALAAFVFFLGWDFIFGFGEGYPRPLYMTVSLASISIASLFLGAWLSAAERLRSAEVKTLESIFAETFDTWIRAAVLLGLGVLVILLLHKGAVVVAFGGEDSDLSTAKVLSNLPAAVLVGALLGISERLLPEVLFSRSRQLAEQLGAGTPPPPGGTDTPPGAGTPPPPGGANTPPAEGERTGGRRKT